MSWWASREALSSRLDAELEVVVRVEIDGVVVSTVADVHRVLAAALPDLITTRDG